MATTSTDKDKDNDNDKSTPAKDMDSLQKLGTASTAYTRALIEAQQDAGKRYQALLNDLSEAVRAVAQDRSASDLVTRYQLEVMRQVRSQDASGLQQQYVDTVQQLLRLQEHQGTALRSAVEAVQSKAEGLAARSGQAAEAAAQQYAAAVKSVAADDALREIDTASLAQWGYGVLVAAALRTQQTDTK